MATQKNIMFIDITMLCMCDNPSDGESILSSKAQECNAKHFENHLNPVMLVFKVFAEY